MVGFQSRADAGLPPLPSTPYLIVDADSGKVYARNKAFVRWAPASLTKLMTAYTVFRRLEIRHLTMSSPVQITPEAIAQPPSKMGLPVGTIMTIENALKIIMVKSANDVSVALGQAVGGSEAEFVKLMNIYAKRLGMNDSHFTNPHGLHDPRQHTSAHDMAVLAIAIGKEFPQYAEFFDIPALRVAGRRLRNHNALLRLFEGTNGMKTGYVCASGFNVVVRTKREGRELVAVVLGHKTAFSRSVMAAELLTEAFAKDPGKFRPTLASINKPDDTTDVPVDVTRIICPRQRPVTVVPLPRPSEAPLSIDFDPVDTQLQESDLAAEVENFSNPPIPTRRPFYKFVPLVSIVDPKNASAAYTGSSSEKPKAKRASLKQRAKELLKPRKDLRKPVRIRLGAGAGPDPFGITQSFGGIPDANLPIPQKRPALDLAETQE